MNQSVIKQQAKEHELFKRMCIGLAQRVHKTDVRLRMGLMGKEQASKVRPLNENKAIENGANFISETFIFSVAGGLILFESWRQRQKELSRRESVADDIKTLQYEIDYLKKKLREYDVRLDDYVSPKDYNPSVLKLGHDDVRLDEKVEELKAKMEELDVKVEPAVIIANPDTKTIPNQSHLKKTQTKS